MGNAAHTEGAANAKVSPVVFRKCVGISLFFMAGAFIFCARNPFLPFSLRAHVPFDLPEVLLFCL